MIKITYNHKKMELKVKGHANAAPAGDDLVCAGVSTLTVALACALKDAGNQGFIEDMILDVDAGDAHIKVKPKEGAEELLRVIFTTILNGYDALGISYPQYVSFTPLG